MAEQILYWKTKDNLHFSTKELAEKYEEILDFVNYIKETDEVCLSCKTKCCKLIADYDLDLDSYKFKFIKCDKEDEFIENLIENYHNLKDYFINKFVNKKDENSIKDNLEI